MLLNTWGLTLVQVHYELNKEFITKYYCINTEKKSLQCEGKCYLKTSLEQQNQEDEHKTASTQSINLSLEYLESNPYNPQIQYPTSISINPVCWINFYQSFSITPPTHPPALLSTIV